MPFRHDQHPNWRTVLSKSESQKARIKLYRNKTFRRQLADGLGLGGIRKHVASCLDALLDARRLPSRGETNSRAAAMDAALIMIAIGTIQTEANATLQMSDRLAAMKLCETMDTSAEVERKIPIAAATELIADLATTFERYFASPDGAFLEGLYHTAFISKIAGAPGDDAVTLLHFSDSRRNSYSAVTSSSTERARGTTRGGMTLMPSALANFAEQIRRDLDGTAATVRGSGQPAAASDIPSGSTANEPKIATTNSADGPIMSLTEFTRIALEHCREDHQAAGETLLLFDLTGRAALGGVEYRRDGGPSNYRKQLAAQILQIGGMAVEIAKTHPEGWVAVDAFGRPCCRLGESFFEFHREAKIVVFESEDECKRFTACVNAQSGNDPALPACSLPTRRFAKEAAVHAEMYRRVIDAEKLDIHIT